MVNATAKGKRNENKTAQYLRDRGYIVEKTKRSRFGDQDFFGLFDIIAIRPDGFVRFIQVKTGRVPEPKVRDVYDEFAKGKTLCSTELWIWYDHDPNPRIFVFDAVSRLDIRAAERGERQAPISGAHVRRQARGARQLGADRADAAPGV